MTKEEARMYFELRNWGVSAELSFRPDELLANAEFAGEKRRIIRGMAAKGLLEHPHGLPINGYRFTQKAEDEWSKWYCDGGFNQIERWHSADPYFQAA